ncbi:LOW QUALITY PROTEIN: hypothetical protein HID58_023910 [Brassica napus]|uniref:Uncharacterized protein n=1 Tax=Brassica napus TaxID=3708 RepID=A0ABQ8D3G9_BRANA|nr:LOW QUALITY PROTEIN: hypothetical protein HID58_023910 [Brassica napus]
MERDVLFRSLSLINRSDRDLSLFKLPSGFSSRFLTVIAVSELPVFKKKGICIGSNRVMQRQRRDRKSVRQPVTLTVTRPSAYRRRWLSSLSFRSSSRVVAPICRFSLTCARIWGFVPGRARFFATLLPLNSRRGALFLFRDVEAPIALASPIKFLGCGGFFSSVASAKLPERGDSYSSIAYLGGLAIAVKKVWSLRALVWLGESVGGSPVVVEAAVMLWIAMECSRHPFLSWA